MSSYSEQRGRRILTPFDAAHPAERHSRLLTSTAAIERPIRSSACSRALALCRYGHTPRVRLPSRHGAATTPTLKRPRDHLT